MSKEYKQEACVFNMSDIMNAWVKDIVVKNNWELLNTDWYYDPAKQKVVVLLNMMREQDANG